MSRARPETHMLTVEEMTNQMIQDIEVGAEGTDIKCGVIGEVGCQSPITGGFIYIYVLINGDMFHIQVTQSNCIFKFPVFSRLFPCQTASFPRANLRDL